MSADRRLFSIKFSPALRAALYLEPPFKGYGPDSDYISTKIAEGRDEDSNHSVSLL